MFISSDGTIMEKSVGAIDANFLARLVTEHVLDEGEAAEMVVDLAYTLAKKTYRL